MKADFDEFAVVYHRITSRLSTTWSRALRHKSCSCFEPMLSLSLGKAGVCRSRYIAPFCASSSEQNVLFAESIWKSVTWHLRSRIARVFA
jgi:hypothetical protein